MSREKKFIIDRLPERFNEGLFCGNGFIGGLIYVADNSLRIAVDHMQLWECRDSEEDMPQASFSDFINNPEKFHNGTYFQDRHPGGQKIWRTRLPGLSVWVELQKTIVDFYGELNLETAVADIQMKLEDGSAVNCKIYIDSEVNVLSVSLDTKQCNVCLKGWEKEGESLCRLKEWGYPDAAEKKEDGIIHIVQPYSESGAAVLSMVEGAEEFYITLNAEVKNADAEKLLRENDTLLKKYAAQPETFFKKHLEAWEDFFRRSEITVPDAYLQQAYDLEMYKIFCNERRKSWPVTLQGIWNNDVRMPAWCGDFHNDMNVQACYWPVYKTNHIELAEAYVDYYTQQAMPRLMERAEKLFGIKDAIHCPVMMGVDGFGAGAEWCFWNCLLGPELFVATDFVWYYEFSRDKKRLESAVYPFIEKVLHLYQGIAYMGEDGYYHIPFSNSPEVFKDGPMLIRDDATIVIATLHYLLEHMEKYAKMLGKVQEQKEYAEFGKMLTPVKTTEKGYPLFPEEDVFESHRHFCQLFPVFPLGTDVHSDLAKTSLHTVIDQGFTEYAGWSFPYMSIFASRCGYGNMARMMVDIYCKAFRSRNSFVVNGDPNQNGILKVSTTNAGEPSDTFTLEAGFIMAAAMSEMFVHRSGNTVYIAAGIPDEWKACSCQNLTIEGGHRISVTMENYRVTRVCIEGACDETLTLNVGNDSYEVELTEGKRMEKTY